jgi:hypothetical protein
VIIKDLYREFDPHRASEIILDTSGNADDRVKHLVFNMLLAWALWPGTRQSLEKMDRALWPETSQDAVKRAARITTQSMMLQIQLQIQSAYREARRTQRRQAPHLTLVHATVQELNHPNVGTFYHEIFIPVGGWNAIRRAVTDKTFLNSIKAQWGGSKYVAAQVEYLLRCIKYNPKCSGVLRSADFIEEAPLKGGILNKNYSDALSLWGLTSHKHPYCSLLGISHMILICLSKISVSQQQAVPERSRPQLARYWR